MDKVIGALVGLAIIVAIILFAPWLTFWIINTLWLSNMTAIGVTTIPYSLFTAQWFAALIPWTGAVLAGFGRILK